MFRSAYKVFYMNISHLYGIKSNRVKGKLRITSLLSTDHKWYHYILPQLSTSNHNESINNDAPSVPKHEMMLLE
jgi:hypothetical protein